VDPRRIDPATRITLALLSKLFNWRDALVVVQPKTLIRWHRAGFRLLWHWKSKPGRPPIPAELRRLIREMSRDNSLWGEERIANELLVKLGIEVSPRTVRKYMRRKPGLGPHSDQRWRTFLRNHAADIVACDFCVAVTASFRVPYIFCHHRARLTPSAPLECDVQSDGGLDVAAVAQRRSPLSILIGPRS
jgi:putative transposase